MKYWLQALFKRNTRDAGCQREVVEIICMTIADKGTKGKTGKPLHSMQHPIAWSAAEEQDMSFLSDVRHALQCASAVQHIPDIGYSDSSHREAFGERPDKFPGSIAMMQSV